MASEHNHWLPKLSRTGETALRMISILTVIYLLYFYFMGRGPMYWTAAWLADKDGRVSLSLSLLISFIPLSLAEWMIIFGVDRLLSRHRYGISSRL